MQTNYEAYCEQYKLNAGPWKLTMPLLSAAGLKAFNKHWECVVGDKLSIEDYDLALYRGRDVYRKLK